MMNLPDDLQPIVEAATNEARRKLEAGEEIPGLAFLKIPDGDGCAMIPMSMFPHKDLWARFVRGVSEIAESPFVLIVSEVWVAESSNRDDVEKLVEQYGQVRHVPGRREALLVQIETHVAFWQGFAYLEKRDGGGKTFGTLDLKMMSGEGRLVGLLGRRSTDKTN